MFIKLKGYIFSIKQIYFIVDRIELQTPTQAHFGPGPIGGSDPDPDPVIGRGIGPDPDPVIGRGTGPDPVGGNSSDPDPVPVGSSPPQSHLEILTFPFAALASMTPHPLISTPLAAPEHFLSQEILVLAQEPLAHLQSTVHLHLLFPNRILAFTGARADLPAAISPGAGMPGTMASKKSGTHWHLPSPSWLILFWTALVCSIIPIGQTATIMSGHMVSYIMGHTLVNPLPQTMDFALTGQLQAHSQLLPPSGQSQLQEHCMPSPVLGTGPDPDPVGGRGTGPDPDPVIGRGTGPDPDPVGGRGTGPDPDPVIGRGSGPEPDPVGGSGADPDPLGGGPDPVGSGSDPDPTGGSTGGSASA